MNHIDMKDPVHLTREEQETIITFTNASHEAEIYTCDPVMLRYLSKIAAEDPDHFTLTEEVTAGGELISRTYTCPKRLARPRKTRMISEEQRIAAAERLRGYHEQKEQKEEE